MSFNFNEFNEFDDRRNNRKRDRHFEDMQTVSARSITSTDEVDLDEELAKQLAEAIAFRDTLLLNKEAYNPKDVTDAIKTVNTLLSQLVKLREQVQNMDRMRRFEEAVVEAVKELPKEAKDRFFSRLESIMPAEK